MLVSLTEQSHSAPVACATWIQPRRVNLHVVRRSNQLHMCVVTYEYVDPVTRSLRVSCTVQLLRACVALS